MDGVEVKVGGDNLGVGIVGGMLNGAEVVDRVVVGDDNKAAGMLSGCPPHTCAAEGQTVDLDL